MWYPTECAPITCPVEVIRGGFILEDGSTVSLPRGTFIANGWGALGSLFLAGDEFKAYPQYLIIAWLSYRDRTFYEGDFELPVEVITKEFEKGFISPLDNRRKTYQFVLVGMAPGGNVSVWLHGDSLSKEVAFFKGKVNKNYNYSRLIGAYQNFDAYVNEQMDEYFAAAKNKEIFKLSTDASLWQEHYRKPYNINLQLLTLGEPVSILVDYYNGEREYRIIEDAEEATCLRVIPKEVAVEWNNPVGQMLKLFFAFDFDELYKSIKALEYDELAAPLSLQLILSEHMEDKSARLIYKNQFVLIKNALTSSLAD